MMVTTSTEISQRLVGQEPKRVRRAIRPAKLWLLRKPMDYSLDRLRSSQRPELQRSEFSTKGRRKLPVGLGKTISKLWEGKGQNAEAGMHRRQATENNEQQTKSNVRLLASTGWGFHQA